MTQTKEMRQWVEQYHKLGLNPIPIKELSKGPNIPETTLCFNQKLPDEIIFDWLRKGLYENVALIGGINNLECFDFDDPQSFKDLVLSEEKLIKQGAWITKTPKQEGRYHVVVRNKNKTAFTRQSRCGVERRVNEHYWLVYPSIHPNGKPYDLLNTHDPQELKLPVEIDSDKMWDQWVQELQKKRGVKETHEDNLKNKNEYDNSPDCIRSAWEQGAKIGQRYYTSLALASWMRQQKIPIDIAKAIITEWHTTKNEQTAERPIEDIVKAVDVAYHKKYMTGCTYLRNNTEHCPHQDKTTCKFFNPDDDTKINPVVVNKNIEDIENNTTEEKEILEETVSEKDESFLGICRDYYKKRTNAPEVFGDHLTLHVLGHAVGVHTAHFIQPKPIHFNTYLSLIAPSTISHKTTIQDLAVNLCSGQRLPSSFSPEGLLIAIQGNPQGILSMGEFSTVLRHIKGNGYMANFKEVANELHSCPPVYEKRLSKMKDSVIICDPYLCISTTCTPEEFLSNLNDELVYGGFLARFVLVNGKVKYKERKELPEDILKEESRIRKVFWKVKALFDNEEKEENVGFKFTEDGLQEFNRIDKMLLQDGRWRNVQPFAGRYLDYIIVYADLLFLCDLIGAIGIDNFNTFNNLNNLNNFNNFTKNDSVYKETNKDDQLNSLKSLKLLKLLKFYAQTEGNKTAHIFNVPGEYVTKAFRMLEPCLKFASEIVRYVNEDMVVSRLSSVLEKHAPLVRSIAMRYSKLQNKDFKEALTTLQEREEVFELSIEHETQQFRPLRVYCTRENIDTPKCETCLYKCSLDQRFPRLSAYHKGGS